MTRKQKRIGTIDAETDPFNYGDPVKPFSWGFYDGENYVDFWGDDCNKQLVDYLTDETDIILYAHNGGRFDFHFLLPWLDEDIMMIHGRIARATMFNGAIELRDSWLILPMPLAQHKKDKIDYRKFYREVREKNKDEILRYQRSDCLYLHDWVIRFIDQFGSGLTLAGAAFNELKKTSYTISRTYEKYDDTFRPFYFGGRVQCFDVGAFNGDYIYIDINSAYSYGMKHRHWYGSNYVEQLKLPEKENGSWFAEIDAISSGALPFRGDDNKLYFPADNIVRKYRASGWEITAGLDTGTLKIIKVHKAYRPQFLESFDEYVDYFFKMKQDAKKRGDKTTYQFAKFFLNSCYGKFGQDGRKFEKFCLQSYGTFPDPIERLDDETDDDYRARNWSVYGDTPTGYRIYSRPDPQNSFFNVATAASITGFVRAYLWRAICQAETPLYCDTDSIICKGFDGNIGKTLGAWDIEAEPKEVYIAQRKMYALKMADGTTKTASKGVTLSFDDIKEGVINGTNITQYRDAPAFSLKHGQRFFSRETNFEDIVMSTAKSPEERMNLEALKLMRNSC